MTSVSRILIVDDEEPNLDILSRRLQKAGYEVETAQTGRQALEIVEHGSVDMMLLDLMMPGMSGLDTLQELRKKHSAHQFPVIMVTAVSESSNIAEALDLGANDYVTKPVDFQVALARIRTQLSLRQADQELLESKERYQLALRSTGTVLLDWDMVNDTVYRSPEWFQLLGYEPDDNELKSEKWFSRVHSSDLPALVKALEADEEVCQENENRTWNSAPIEFRIRHRNGDYRWVSLQSMTLRGKDGRAVRRIGSLIDITAQRTIDELTGLATSDAMTDEVDIAILKNQENPASTFAVMVFDVDRFNMIEENLGEAGCVEFLQQVAQKAQSALIDFASSMGVSNTRILRSAHVSRDEFGLVIDPVRNREEAESIADRLVRAMRSAFSVAKHELNCSIRVGMVLYQPEYRDGQAMISDARTALYAARSQNASPWKFFDLSMRRLQEERFQMDIDLRLALERLEFEVYYQSRVHLATERICGFEALARWNHPHRGLIPPDVFIPVAEENGLVHEIGVWVLRKACEQQQQWQETYELPRNFEISVNLSASQCREPHLVQEVADILQLTGLPPANLNLELTESLLLADIEEAKTVLKKLKSLGVGLKIDDFGTGYSNLKYLSELPFDCLKIDRSFTTDLGKDKPDTDEVIRTILQMARNLKMDVVAEGIENAEQLEQLLKMGCEYGQGYYFSPPVCATDAESLLKANLLKASLY
jgi:PAS domain S-box-containing protein